MHTYALCCAEPERIHEVYSGLAIMACYERHKEVLTVSLVVSKSIDGGPWRASNKAPYNALRILLCHPHLTLQHHHNTLRGSITQQENYH